MVPFDGAKAALFCGSQLAVLRRDAKLSIPHPGLVDLPGGGREGDESPADCAAREIHEEMTLVIAPERFVWARSYALADALPNWFLAADLTLAETRAMRLGDEGQALWMVPHLQARLGDCLEALDRVQW